MSEHRFPPIVKDPAEVRSVILRFYKVCANIWRPNEVYDASEFVRPTRGNGFSFVSNGGTSGSREPVWPKTLGATVIDGSVTWTCMVAADNGLNPISAPTAVPDPGLSVSSLIVSEFTNLLADYTGGTDGQDYTVVFSVLVNGRPRVARQMVQVRQR